MSKKDFSVSAGIMELPSGKCFEVGSHEWWDWISSSQAESFRFECDFGVKGYRARREEIKSRAGSFWYAYKRVEGKLRKRYLGKSEELTLERLESVAYDLAKPAQTRQPEVELPNKSVGNYSTDELRKSLQEQRANALERENCYQQLLEQKIRLEKQVQELKEHISELHNTLGNKAKISLDGIKVYKLHGRAVVRVDDLLTPPVKKVKPLTWEERVNAVVGEL
jgi:hypothetical protein